MTYAIFGDKENKSYEEYYSEPCVVMFGHYFSNPNNSNEQKIDKEGLILLWRR
jgi:hypothetical protein